MYVYILYIHIHVRTRGCKKVANIGRLEYLQKLKTKKIIHLEVINIP